MKDAEPKAMPRRFRTAELSGEEAERIEASRMDKRHDHLNALLDDEIRPNDVAAPTDGPPLKEREP